MGYPVSHAILTTNNVLHLELHGNPTSNAANAFSVAMLIPGVIVGPVNKGRGIRYDDEPCCPINLKLL